jgi:hypothetical protein
MSRFRIFFAPAIVALSLVAASLTPARAQAVDPVARGLAAKALGQSFTLPYTGNCASVTSACFTLQNPSGTAVFSVDKTGVIIAAATASRPLGGVGTIVLSGGFAGYGLGFSANGEITSFINGNPSGTIGNSVRLNNNVGVFSLGTSADVVLARDGANTLAQRNGVNAQTSRVYNTFTDASNGEWAELTWLSNVAYLRPQANGTGTARPLVPVTGATTVAGLPSAATAGRGARLMVTDATACTFAAAPTGGGSTVCPVYSDGTNWKEG